MHAAQSWCYGRPRLQLALLAGPRCISPRASALTAASQCPWASGLHFAGGSPRASSPPLDGATSAPVFEDDAGPSSGSGSDDEAHSGILNGSAAGGTLRNRFASPPRSVFERGDDFIGAPMPMRMDLDSEAGSDLEVRGTCWCCAVMLLHRL